MYTIIRFFCVAFLCCITAFHSDAQTPYLEKDVTIRSGTYAYEDLFRQISNQTGVVFSYTGFDDQHRVSVRFDKQPLRIVLNTLSGNGNFTYKLKEKYVILSTKPAPKPKSEHSPVNNSNLVLNGYILNAEDSTEIEESSVYIKQSKQSALTNEYGYFNLSFPKTTDVLSISVAKEDFKDTTVVIVSKQQNTLVIYLQPKSAPVSVTVDSVRLTLSIDSVKPSETPVKDTLPAINPFWKRFRDRSANLRNITDTLFTRVSFSLFPPVSTNRLLSVNTVNKFSFNLLVGSSKGIDVFELGGLVNFDYGNVKYVQIAGLTNLVSGTSSGVQVAGLVNLDGGKVKYVQVAGIANLVKDTVKGVQIGGVANLNTSYTRGVQIAGIYNRSKNIFGAQISGIANMGDTVNGLQLAGLVNSSRVISGFQLSGLINIAKKVNGSQLGFLNIADSISGIPIGFLSFVKNGYHKVELACDENLFGTLSFRTGVDKFHNILIGGIQLSGGQPLWTLGYGVGSAFKLGRKWYLDLDLTAQQLYLNNSELTYNMLTKSFVGIEYRFGKNFSIAAGPTLNWYASDSDPINDPIWGRIRQKTVSNSVDSGYYYQLWVGGKLAIRFF
jgi:hypothetical protein